MRVVFHRLARREYLKSRRWYAVRSQYAEDRFVAATDRALDDALRRFASLPVIFKHYRRISLQRFPFNLILRELEPATLLVVAVAHHKRRPGYWRRRQ